MQELTEIQRVVIWILPVLFAITVHEMAHGWMANKLGDPTAKMMGRVTLNPIKHIDPIGTVVLPLILMWIGGFVFGWAKPVPVTWENLRNKRRDVALVAFAGPGANIIMALMWALLLKLGDSMVTSTEWLAVPLVYMGAAGVFINLILFVLNLLPLPPLDGGRIVSSLLPGPWSYKFDRIEPYGMFILIGLVILGVLGKILLPLVFGLQSIIFSVFGLA